MKLDRKLCWVYLSMGMICLGLGFLSKWMGYESAIGGFGMGAIIFGLAGGYYNFKTFKE